MDADIDRSMAALEAEMNRMQQTAESELIGSMDNLALMVGESPTPEAFQALIDEETVRPAINTLPIPVTMVRVIDQIRHVADGVDRQNIPVFLLMRSGDVYTIPARLDSPSELVGRLNPDQENRINELISALGIESQRCQSPICHIVAAGEIVFSLHPNLLSDKDWVLDILFSHYLDFMRLTKAQSQWFYDLQTLVGNYPVSLRYVSRYTETRPHGIGYGRTMLRDTLASFYKQLIEDGMLEIADVPVGVLSDGPTPTRPTAEEWDSQLRQSYKEWTPESWVQSDAMHPAALMTTDGHIYCCGAHHFAMLEEMYDKLRPQGPRFTYWPGDALITGLKESGFARCDKHGRDLSVMCIANPTAAQLRTVVRLIEAGHNFTPERKLTIETTAGSRLVEDKRALFSFLRSVNLMPVMAQMYNQTTLDDLYEDTAALSSTEIWQNIWSAEAGKFLDELHAHPLDYELKNGSEGYIWQDGSAAIWETSQSSHRDDDPHNLKIAVLQDVMKDYPTTGYKYVFVFVEGIWVGPRITLELHHKVTALQWEALSALRDALRDVAQNIVPWRVVDMFHELLVTPFDDELLRYFILHDNAADDLKAKMQELGYPTNVGMPNAADFNTAKDKLFTQVSPEEWGSHNEAHPAAFLDTDGNIVWNGDGFQHDDLTISLIGAVQSKAPFVRPPDAGPEWLMSLTGWIRLDKHRNDIAVQIVKAPTASQVRTIRRLLERPDFVSVTVESAYRGRSKRVEDHRDLFAWLRANDMMPTMADTADYDVAATSIKQVAALLKSAPLPTGVNLDYGGGKYDLGTEYLASKGITNLVYDIYSRDTAHNNAVLAQLAVTPADSATLANVLNVIDTEGERVSVLNHVLSLVKTGAPVFISVYHDAKLPQNRVTSRNTYQANLPLADYLPTIKSVMPDAHIVRDYIVGTATTVRALRTPIYTWDTVIQAMLIPVAIDDLGEWVDEWEHVPLYCTQDGRLWRHTYRRMIHAVIAKELIQHVDDAYPSDPIEYLATRSHVMRVDIESTGIGISLFEKPTAPQIRAIEELWQVPQLYDLSITIEGPAGAEWLSKHPSMKTVSDSAQSMSDIYRFLRWTDAMPVMAEVVTTPRISKKAQRLAGKGADYPQTWADALRELRNASFLPTDEVIRWLGERPSYLDDVIYYLTENRYKLAQGKLTVRDVAKAYIITVMSQQAGAIPYNTFYNKTGYFVPEFFRTAENGIEYVRPEEVAAFWLTSPEGQIALNALEDGTVESALWGSLARIRKLAFGYDIFGGSNVFGESCDLAKSAKSANIYNLRNIHELTDKLNECRGNTGCIDNLLLKMGAISYGKKGFIKHLLGLGNDATLDAIEINFWITGDADGKTLNEARQRLQSIAKDWMNTEQVRAYLKERLDTIFAEMRDKGLAADLSEDVWAHVIHHWIWDKAKGTETTHQGVYDAMERAMALPAIAITGVVSTSTPDQWRDAIAGIWQVSQPEYWGREVHGVITPDGSIFDSGDANKMHVSLAMSALLKLEPRNLPRLHGPDNVMAYVFTTAQVVQVYWTHGRGTSIGLTFWHTPTSAQMRAIKRITESSIGDFYIIGTIIDDVSANRFQRISSQSWRELLSELRKNNALPPMADTAEYEDTDDTTEDAEYYSPTSEAWRQAILRARTEVTEGRPHTPMHRPDGTMQEAWQLGGYPMEGEVAAADVGEPITPSADITEWIQGGVDGPAIVVDDEAARISPCILLELGRGRRYVYKKGLVGTLDESQERLYCGQGYVVRYPSEAQRQRLTAIAQAAEVCSREPGAGDSSATGLSKYFTCLGRELRTKGVGL